MSRRFQPAGAQFGAWLAVLCGGVALLRMTGAVALWISSCETSNGNWSARSCWGVIAVGCSRTVHLALVTR
jgi:hypothetical protein